MVLWKNSLAIFSEFTKRREGSRRINLPNLVGQKQKECELNVSVGGRDLTFSSCYYVWRFCGILLEKKVQLPDTLVGIHWMDVLTQQHLWLGLQILHLFWIFKVSYLCVGDSNSRHRFGDPEISDYHRCISDSLPGLNSTIAFRQANSVGSTVRALKRLKTSSKICRSAVRRLILACCGVERSGRDKRGQLSMGRDHWMAHRRNISLQASSRRITWGFHRNEHLISLTHYPYMLKKHFKMQIHKEKISVYRPHLVTKWQVSKHRQIFCPLDWHEEESCRCLIHILWTAGGIRGQTAVEGSEVPLWICCHINIFLHCVAEKET